MVQADVTGRTLPGEDIYSHFDVIYYYPNGIHVSFSSAQFGQGKFDVSERFFGTKGLSQSPYSGALGIAGDAAWTWSRQRPGRGDCSPPPDIHGQSGRRPIRKTERLYRQHRHGKFHNQAALGVETALTAMLGREAAYQGRELTWDEL